MTRNSGVAQSHSKVDGRETKIESNSRLVDQNISHEWITLLEEAKLCAYDEEGYCLEPDLADAIAEVEDLIAKRPKANEHKMNDSLFDCTVVPRPLAYPLKDYHHSIFDGPLHFTWEDKPHRIVYDLIAAVRYYALQNKEDAKWVLVTEELLNGRFDWLYRPLWLALKDGTVIQSDGLFNRDGPMCFLCAGETQVSAFDVNHVAVRAPVIPPRPPLDKS